MRILLSLSVLLFGVAVVSGQSYYFDNYAVKDGLAHSTVYAVHQDQHGYMWLGTGSGISRFDGTEFINYTTDDGIAGNAVRTICQDTAGNIWFGHTGGGVTKFNGERFSTVQLDSLEISSDISAIELDHKGHIWIATAGNGIFYLPNPAVDAETPLEYKNYKGSHGLSDRVFDIYRSVSGQIYFITDVGIKVYDAEKDEFEVFDVPESIPTYFIFTNYFEDSKGVRWFGTYNGGLYRLGKEEGDVKIYDVKDGLAHNWISRINEDENGNIWAGTWGGGLTRIAPDGSLITFSHKNGLNATKIWDIMSDREGNVVIATNEHGLNFFKGEHFVAYTSAEGISHDQVWGALEDEQNRIWLATNNGISILNQDRVTRQGDEEDNGWTYVTQENGRLPSDEVRFLKMDNNNDIWIGTNGGGVVMTNTDDNSYYYPPRLNSNIKFGLVTAMDIDSENNLWVGALNGLIFYDINRRQLNVLTQGAGLAGNEVSEVFCDSQDRIWVGSKGSGLIRITGTKFEPIDIGGDITPNVIKEDNDGNIWIGTDGQGLMKYNDAQGVEKIYHVEDGLLGGLITSIEIANDNHIWVGTNKGLNQINTESGQISAYTEKDGFTGIEVKLKSSYKDREGHLWFGTVKGAMKYAPELDRSSSMEPLVQITRLRVNLDDRMMTGKDKYTYKDKSFYFDYKGIFFTNPTSVKYLVMLEGIDSHWLPETDLTFANYPALPPGKYTFKVKASNGSGGWTEEPASYHFVIKPPFWKTWWFYLFCAIFAGSWIAYLIKLREEKLKEEKKILEEKVAERTQEVVEKNKELASKNKDITDSIRYAQRIQRAILPPDEMVKQALPNSFVFFRPKDIVSGDFYWVSQSNGTVLFSAVDCTGHGVPGAFMSIIGHNSLDKIVKELGMVKPADILDELNQSVSVTLRQKSETGTVKDGMDLALVAINAEEKKLHYAGAHNPLYIFRNGELLETKADKFAIGSFIRGEKRKFTSHEFDIVEGDMVYIFSDGFPDQFGGEKGKKYKYRPFKEFLLSIHEKPMEEQLNLLEAEFVRWLGRLEQIDDVIIMGVRV